MNIPEHIVPKLTAVFKLFPEIEEVIVYGSRALGNAKEGSDIDLAIKGKIEMDLIRKLELAIDDLFLPWSFDVSNYPQITNQSLIDHIDRVGIKIYP